MRRRDRSNNRGRGERGEPQFILPSGYETPGGVYVPTEFRLPAEGQIQLPVELRPNPALIATTRPPAFVDQVWTFATEEELGINPTPKEVVVEAIQLIPLWPAMKMVARLQRDLWHVGTDTAGQLEILQRFYGDGSGYTRRATAFLSAGGQRVVFSEQQAFTLQKLLLLYASDSDPEEELSPIQYQALLIALGAIPGSVLGPQAETLTGSDTASPTDETWLRLFVGHGGFAGRGSMKHELARTNLLYIISANTEAARGHVDFCPLDEWIQATFGLSFVELEAVGFALWAGSQMGAPENVPVLVDTAYFLPTALGGKAQTGLDAISEEPNWYREAIRKSEHDDRRLAYDISPFLQRPALRLSDGRVMPFAPRAIESWLGATGAYYRFFDLARARGDATRLRFARFNGFLCEQHVLAASRAAHVDAGEGPIWVPTVHGEEVVPTPKGEVRTPDVAIDYGPDLVLVEVMSGRPTTRCLVDADPEAIRRDIERLLAVKIRQLGRRIQDLQAKRIQLPNVDIDQVARIWPLIVNSEGLLQTPVLWSYLREESRSLDELDQPRVQPLTLLDLEDIERLMGLVSSGQGLTEILGDKTQPAWRDRELASWMEFVGYAAPDFSFIDQASDTAFETLISALLGDMTPEEYAQRVEATRMSEDQR